MHADVCQCISYDHDDVYETLEMTLCHYLLQKSLAKISLPWQGCLETLHLKLSVPFLCDILTTAIGIPVVIQIHNYIPLVIDNTFLSFYNVVNAIDCVLLMVLQTKDIAGKGVSTCRLSREAQNVLCIIQENATLNSGLKGGETYQPGHDCFQLPHCSAPLNHRWYIVPASDRRCRCADIR